MTKGEALTRLKKLCSTKEKCPYDIYMRLSQWGIDGDDARELTDELIREKYIDEARYARAFINDKLVFNQWGRHKIKNGLIQKKIDIILIDDALQSIEPDMYMKIVKKILTYKMKSINYDGTYKSRVKLMKYAYNKGFETDITGRVLQSLTGEDFEIE